MISKPLSILHGDFGRVVLASLTRSMACHAHRDCHVIVNMSPQTIVFGVNHQEYMLGSGKMLLVNAWEPHYYKHHSAHDAVTLLTFYFNPTWLKAIDKTFALSGHPRFFSRPVWTPSATISQLFEDVIESLPLAVAKSILHAEDCLTPLLTTLCCNIMALVEPPTKLIPAGMFGEWGFDARIRAVVEKAISSRNALVTVADLLAATTLSRAQFFRLFGRSTGLAPATFLNMLKMEHCLQQLTLGDTPIQDIAEQAGYYPVGNFTRFFINQQGVSPSAYRKMFFNLNLTSDP